MTFWISFAVLKITYCLLSEKLFYELPQYCAIIDTLKRNVDVMYVLIPNLQLEHYF